MYSIGSLLKSLKAIGQPDSRFLDLYIPALVGYSLASKFRADTDYEINMGVNGLKSGIFGFLSIAYLIIVYTVTIFSLFIVGMAGAPSSLVSVQTLLTLILVLPFYIFQFTGHLLRESHGVLESFGKSISIVRERPGDSLIFFLIRFVIPLGILASISYGGLTLVLDFKGYRNAHAAYIIWIYLVAPLTYLVYSHWGRVYTACFIDALQGKNKKYPNSGLTIPTINPKSLILTGIILSILGSIAYSIALSDIWLPFLGIILLISGIIGKNRR